MSESLKLRDEEYAEVGNGKIVSKTLTTQMTASGIITV